MKKIIIHVLTRVKNLVYAYGQVHILFEASKAESKEQIGRTPKA